MNIVSVVFLISWAANLIVELILNIKNQFHIALYRNEVPADFVTTIDLPSHQKAADYSREKLQLGRFILFFDAALILIMTIGGGFQDIYSLWQALTIPQLWQDVGFLIFTFWFLALLHLPFNIISTFKIEAKFGFNRTSPRQFISDLFKQWLLMLIIGLPLLWVIVLLMNNFIDQAWWLAVWGVWMTFNLLLLWAYPRWIAPLFNQFTPLEEGEMKQRIEALLDRTGFESNGIFIMDGSSRSGHGNAYFTGMGKNKRIVFFDTLLDKLSVEEVEAVLAHELGHFKHGHIKKRLWMSALMSFIGLALLGVLVQWDAFYIGLGISSATPAAALLLFITAVPLMFFFLSPIMAVQSRKDEFEADAFAAQYVGAENLISALLKLYRDNASTLTPDPAYSAYHDSHPPAKIRIDHLKNASSDFVNV